MKLWVLLAVFVSFSARAAVWTVWVEPCAAAQVQRTGCHASDPELAQWALEDWARRSEGNLSIQPVKTESAARLIVHWAGGADGLYGETRSHDFEGQRGAIVYVLPTTGAQDDTLLRDAIVYLTCVHESGHALGLPHTDRFEDIMYSFQFGGDIPEYFGRYRRKLHSRQDIHMTSAISRNDQLALRLALAH